MGHRIFFSRLCIILIVLLNIGCDQISKGVVRNKVENRDYIQLLDDYFILTNVENTGAMLGFGEGFSPLLKVLFLQALPSFVLLLLLLQILRKTNMNRWFIIAFSFVIGGGIGNLFDRIVHGSVTDFFQIKIGVLRTGIFNMADVSVTMGVLCILIISLRNKNIAI